MEPGEEMKMVGLCYTLRDQEYRQACELMAKKPTLTKVILPQRRKELFTRQRLINLLYDLLDEKLILVIAPAGYGKTSLLVDFAHQVDFPVCWYAVDELDQTPERFFTYFIAAIHQQFPAFGEASRAALKAINPFTPDINQLVSVIVNDAYEHIQEHFLIILDDYHLVSNVKEIQAFLNRFINTVGRKLPSGLKLTDLAQPARPAPAGSPLAGGWDWFRRAGVPCR